MEIIYDSIQKVELSRDRYQQLEQENEVIQTSLANLRAKMASESAEHGLTSHLTSPRDSSEFISLQPKKYIK